MTRGHEDAFRGIVDRRSELLRAVAAEPRSKPELVSLVDASRSTVDRAIRELQSMACVVRDDDGYVATNTGRLALDAYDTYCRRTAAVLDASEFLAAVPRGAPLDTAMLDGATIALPERHAPERAIQPALDCFERATSLHGLAPTVLSFYPDVIEARVQEAGIDVEIVADPAVINVLPELDRERVEALVRHETVAFYESATELPYALWVMGTPDGDVAGITVYDASGVAATLVNDAADAVAWARTRYEQYRQSAEHVDPSQLV